MVVIPLGFWLDITYIHWISSTCGKTMHIIETEARKNINWCDLGSQNKFKSYNSQLHTLELKIAILVRWDSVTIHKIIVNAYQCSAKLHSLNSSFGSLLLVTFNLQMALKWWGSIFWNCFSSNFKNLTSPWWESSLVLGIQIPGTSMLCRKHRTTERIALSK